MTRVLIASLVAVAALLGGCAQQPSRIAGEPPPGMRSVFVVGYLYHSGLAVRARDVPVTAWPARSDFPAADFLELGWGEREYYPRDDPGVLRALRALFTPSRSTIHALEISGPIERARAENEIVELHVTQDAFARLIAFVRASHELDAQGRAILIESGPKTPGKFYASPGTFHALENCNVWVARALQSAGLPVQPGRAVTPGLLLRQVRPLTAARGGNLRAAHAPESAVRDRNHCSIGPVHEHEAC